MVSVSESFLLRKPVSVLILGYRVQAYCHSVINNMVITIAIILPKHSNCDAIKVGSRLKIWELKLIGFRT